MPADDLAALKHVRVYSRTATDDEIWANAKNSCLSPVAALAVANSPLALWGRFNIPAPGSETTIGPGSIVETADGGRPIVPDHLLSSNYTYNSLNQVIRQSTPDGGTTDFWYDRLGRLVASQNAEQKSPAKGVNEENPANRFSYTRYDALSRIVEVGEKLAAGIMSEDVARNDNQLQNWLNSGTNRQVTLTAYDAAPAWAPASLSARQLNLRKRVAATALLATATHPTNAGAGRIAATYYSYDISGNVSELVQENAALATKEGQYVTNTTGLKHIKYEYDLISGKVNKVLYQDGKWDQFYYQYLYDAENRLVKALSSRNNYGSAEQWVTEATYRYYLHGPLARVELGKNKVQGIDYAYTLQGWLKGVNGAMLHVDKDMSGDGKATGPFNAHAKDAFGFSLGYYENDYKPIGGSSAPAFNLQYQYPELVQGTESGKRLYNGNISHATYAISQLDGGSTVGYTYRYDQLNRLTAMNHHTIAAGAPTWGNNNAIPAYKEQSTYDANGNILSYLRNGAPSKLAMDNLTYSYNRDAEGRLINNKLRHVKDDLSIPENQYSEDLDTQPDNNYQYDRIGNLVGDAKENIEYINWNVYGKIASIRKVGGTTINYGYDAAGNRITKTVSTGSGTTTTYYVRDGQGNVMGLYEDKAGTGFSWQEQHLYGSSRLGMVDPNFHIAAGQSLGSEVYSSERDVLGNGIVGLRRYELSNHLGNVLATISDKKIGVDQNNDGTVDYYLADVLSANDYYPFGMQMPGRKFSKNGSYRYGFNGKENDNETSTQDYGFRIYNPVLGRFLSVDPLAGEYPWNSTYAFAENDVVRSIDIEGAEKHVQTFAYAVSNGETVSKVISNDYKQPAGTSNLYALLGGTPSTTEEDVARGFVSANKLPAGGTFSFFVFAPDLGKANYARYEYIDPGGQQQVRYFDAGYIDRMYDFFDKQQQKAEKILNIASAGANLIGAGALVKAEFKAAAGELNATASGAGALRGSGSVSGVIELNTSVKSNKAFLNGVTKNARDFVYDPVTEKFAMAGSNATHLKHYGLRKVIGATEENVVGGRIKVGNNGEIMTSQWSGTYGTNWTPEIATKFKDFMKKMTDKEIDHSGTTKFTDGTK